MRNAAHAFLGVLVLMVLAGAIGSVVLLTWLAGSDFTEFRR